MSKRESRQFGMTKEREDALKKVREAKQFGKSRLDQVLEEKNLQQTTANEDVDMAPVDDDDDGFIVDDQGNPVQYGKEDDEEPEDVEMQNKEITSGPIHHFIKNMGQAGPRNPNKAIDPKTVQNKQKKIQGILDQLDSDDDEEDEKIKRKKKNKTENLKPYVAPSFDEKMEIDDIQMEDDFDINSLPMQDLQMNEEKPQKRQIKSINKSNVDNFNIQNPTPVKRSRQENISINDIQTRTPIQQNKFNSSSKEVSLSSINRQVAKTENKPKNESNYNNPLYSSSNISLRQPVTTDPLPISNDNCVYMYWYDAIEENIQSKPCVIFFGKVFEPSKNEYSSISLVIKSINRKLYILPKPEYQEKDKIGEVYKEFESLRNSKFSYIKQYLCKPKEKKYCFELPIDNNKIQNVMKISYNADLGLLPANLTGETFSYIFGKNTSLLEIIMLSRRIKGPCWLKISNFDYGNSFTNTWSKYEISIKNYKSFEVAKNYNHPSPPLKILSLSTKSLNTKGGNELLCIACALKNQYFIDDDKGLNKIDDFKPLVFMRKIDSKLPYMDTRTNPPIKTVEYSQVKSIFGEGNLLMAANEMALINQFINKLYAFDPDLIVGHTLYSNHLETITSRINKLKISNWSRIGHFKREMLPKFMQNSSFSNDHIRSCLSGRLICDTFLSTREILLRETNYDLKYLVEKYLNKNLDEINPANVISTFTNLSEISNLLQITLNEAIFSLAIMDKYMILPLTKQLTTIAGNIWIKSLQCSRANRCEMLLLHEFHDKKYLLPDKYHKGGYIDDNDLLAADDDDDDDENKRTRTGRRKPKYSGGLVLEPNPGLYDQIILLLDFNSLYPSIIQEYNICFTTVIRKPTQSFIIERNLNKDKTANKKKNKNNKNGPKSEISKADSEKIQDIDNENLEEGSEEAEEHIDLRDKIKNIGQKAILPSILEFLVKSRKQVRNLQKTEKDKFKYTLLEIKQKALKVSANSLYGFLGYKNSRFYAQEIAALITATGRRILKNAAMIVKKKHGLNVIYGDTDSVMINTMTQDIKVAVELGNKLKKSINDQYKLLEMDIDGLFKSLLLLKKKKYASLKYIPPFNDRSKVEREIKGLDLVRRDWCPLAKNVGSRILDILLSGKIKEEIINDIYEELRNTKNIIDENQVSLDDYAITKQLAKNIEDYNDVKALPHAAVAKRLKSTGEFNVKANAYIPYIVCLPKEGQTSKSISDRSYHPKEIQADPTLVIDSNWYKDNQILSIISRLVHHIEELDRNVLCECLGIENKHQYTGNNNQTDYIQGKLQHLRVKEGITIICPKCKNEIKINELSNKVDCIKKMTDCSNCQSLNKNYGSICNSIISSLKKIIFNYYRGRSNCLKCKDDKSALFFRRKCPDISCRGILQREWNEINASEEIHFLYALTDPSENSGFNIKDPIITDFNNETKKVHEIVKKVYENIDFYKINIGDILSFLNNK